MVSRLGIACVSAGGAAHVVAGVRYYRPDRLVLLVDVDGEKAAREAKAALDPEGVATTIVQIRGDVVREVLKAVTSEAIEARGKFDEVRVNVGAGGSLLALATLSAAHLTGSHAFSVVRDVVTELPVLGFAFDEVVGESKLSLLRALEKAGGTVDSLQVLADLTGEDKSLLSYHLRGTREAKGLEELGLVDIDRGARGRLVVSLTLLGRTLLAARAE